MRQLLKLFHCIQKAILVPSILTINKIVNISEFIFKRSRNRYIQLFSNEKSWSNLFIFQSTDLSKGFGGCVAVLGARERRGCRVRRDEHDEEATPDLVPDDRRREGFQALLRWVHLLRRIHHWKQHSRGQSHQVLKFILFSKSQIR